jgi:DMATS type aromatic prenyltransferase
MNRRELQPTRTVRFTIEATGSQAGTADDPFNQEESKAMLRKMATEVPDLDLELFEHFSNQLFLPAEVAGSLRPGIPAGTPLSQVWVAFDLLPGKQMAKVYFMPILKWMHTGVPTKSLVFEAARTSNAKYGTYDAAIVLLDSYLESFPAGESPYRR